MVLADADTTETEATGHDRQQRRTGKPLLDLHGTALVLLSL